ncbi:putative ribonuclease H protein [Corchorus olitorius]|uniref:Ribonuclease H protein n=1 Tax=Corchorus olitorius TaxID=93759 RepID=A0A1R3I4N6_9ROSI|nr:putative ribonuclease H protein [Corchorus olitorius]
MTETAVAKCDLGRFKADFEGNKNYLPNEKCDNFPIIRNGWFYNTPLIHDNARVPRTSSWPWRSIHEGLEVLKTGLRWNISGGSNVSIRNDPRVPDLPQFRITSPLPYNEGPLLVKDLIDMDRRRWRLDLLHRIFDLSVTKAILKVPIGSPNVQDKLIWHFTKDDSYFVKSGYRLLKSRCGEEVESIEHILFFCPFAQAVWQASNFNYTPRREGFAGFKKWWDEVDPLSPTLGSFTRSGLLVSLVGTFGKLGIYFHLRECRVILYRYGEMQPKISSNLMRLRPWSFAQHFTSTKLNLLAEAPLSYVKINCDASFDGKLFKAGIAAICRDSNGLLIDGASMLVRASSTEMAEALAIRNEFAA